MIWFIVGLAVGMACYIAIYFIVSKRKKKKQKLESENKIK